MRLTEVEPVVSNKRVQLASVHAAGANVGFSLIPNDTCQFLLRNGGNHPIKEAAERIKTELAVSITQCRFHTYMLVLKNCRWFLKPASRHLRWRALLDRMTTAPQFNFGASQARADKTNGQASRHVMSVSKLQANG
jgi:hypothetical protein